VKKLSQIGPLSILERKRVYIYIYIYIYIEKTKGEGFFLEILKSRWRASLEILAASQ
jgi:hypothetical protein